MVEHEALSNCIDDPRCLDLDPCALLSLRLQTLVIPLDVVDAQRVDADLGCAVSILVPLQELGVVL